MVRRILFFTPAFAPAALRPCITVVHGAFKVYFTISHFHPTLSPNLTQPLEKKLKQFKTFQNISKSSKPYKTVQNSIRHF